MASNQREYSEPDKSYCSSSSSSESEGLEASRPNQDTFCIDNKENNSSVMAEEVGMSSFLQKMKSDLMYELRSIEHGQRPVTGQNNRENLQQFMKKHMYNPSSSSAAGKVNVPANVDSVEEHRPEAVIVEVQGIVEQRPVSSILQSAAFRRQLENIIRGSIQPTRRQTGSGRSNTATLSSNNSQTPTASIQVDSGLPGIPRQSVERRGLIRQESSESIESFSSARSSVEDEDIFEEAEVSESHHTAASNGSSQVVDEPEVSPSPPTSARRQMRNIVRDPGQNADLEPEPSNQGISWDNISQVHREEIVQDIGELLHNRLVSSTLEGEFRATLELLFEDRLVASGTNGQAVQDFLHTLPRSHVPRNDFSHLGIAPLPDNDNWDNISVTSVSTHSVPVHQTNSYMSREIQSLKAQMNEMKNMLKLTFDLQMDIQRAVRQEVAAAMNNVTGATFTPPRHQAVNDSTCLICLNRGTDSVLYQCGHMCVCYVCGKDLVSRGHNCPVCRAPIKDVIRAYRTNAD